MLMIEQCNFNFKGFQPEAEFLSFLKTVAEQVQQIAPTDSYLEVEINKKNNFYFGSAAVNSSPARFSATESEDDPMLLVLKLASQIQRQIKNWKRFRFSQPYSEAEVAI